MSHEPMRLPRAVELLHEAINDREACRRYGDLPGRKACQKRVAALQGVVERLAKETTQPVATAEAAS